MSNDVDTLIEVSDRVTLEHKALVENVIKLEGFINMGDEVCIAIVGGPQFTAMKEQLHYMKGYANTLEVRLGIFAEDLGKYR